MRIEVIGLGALNYDVLYAVERIAKGGEEVGIIDMGFLNRAKFLHTSSFVSKEQLDMQCELTRRVKSKLRFSPGMLCFNYKLGGYFPHK